MSSRRTAQGTATAVIGICVLLIGAWLSPAAHADGGVDPTALQQAALPPVGAAGVDPASYAALFAGVPADPPTGAIVADSGFRPFPNGFSFVNYGQDLGLNQVLFGQPSPLTPGTSPALSSPLTPESMRRVFGDGVCLPGSGATCVLTESAKVVMAQTNAWAAGGHCFGFATVANALYTGRLPRTDVGGGQVNTLTTPNDAAQQAILRAFVAQYFSATGIRPATMADAIARLRSSITPGHIPYTMLVYGAPGGHALVPYAVLDRGNGQFDIAVYDPNLPNQARAIHVDTVANAWTFTTSPGVGTATWSSTDPAKPAYFLLGDVASALAQQACPFCQSGRSGTLVSFSPVLTANAGIFNNVTLRDTAGQPLDPSQYRVIPPTNQVSSPLATGPAFVVDPGIAFEIGLDGQSVETVQPLTVTVVASGTTRSLRLETISAGLRGRVRVENDGSTLSFAGVATNKGTATHTFTQGRASYSIQGVETTAFHVEAMDFRSYQVRNRIVFRENDAFAALWSVRLLSRNIGGGSTYGTSGVVVPAGSQLVVLYSGWSGKSGKPVLWLDKGSNGSLDVQIPLHRVP